MKIIFIFSCSRMFQNVSEPETFQNILEHEKNEHIFYEKIITYNNNNN